MEALEECIQDDEKILKMKGAAKDLDTDQEESDANGDEEGAEEEVPKETDEIVDDASEDAPKAKPAAAKQARKRPSSHSVTFADYEYGFDRHLNRAWRREDGKAPEYGKMQLPEGQSNTEKKTQQITVLCLVLCWWWGGG